MFIGEYDEMINDLIIIVINYYCLFLLDKSNVQLIIMLIKV